jgi:hypothetical protein
MQGMRLHIRLPINRILHVCTEEWQVTTLLKQRIWLQKTEAAFPTMRTISSEALHYALQMQKTALYLEIQQLFS